MQTLEIQPRKAAPRCCICKQSIVFEVDSEGTAINPQGFDPCALTLVTNAYGSRADQREQEFPCHMECFRKIVNDDSVMYILESNFETVDEFQQEQGQDGEGQVTLSR